MREIRVHGQSRRYIHTRVGVGGRMDTLQCAILLAKFDRFEWEVEQRLQIGAKYNELLGNRIRKMVQRPDRTSVFAQYTVYVDNREEVQRYLKELDIPTAVHYPVPIPHQTAYAQFAVGAHYPVACDMAKGVMSLPMCPYLDPESQMRAAEAILLSAGSGSQPAAQASANEAVV